MAVVTDGPQRAPLTARAVERAGKVMQLSGAVVSLALVAGVAFWGYKLVVRDVTGIPVVRAMGGPMRVAPADGGGQIALNTGLSVNTVAAQGEAGAPEDVLLLAPTPIALADEDMEVQSMAEAGEVVPIGAGPAEPGAETPILASADGPLTAEVVLALADLIAAETNPLAALEAGMDVPVSTSLDGDAVGGVAASVTVIPASVPGVSTALRPPARPAGFAAAAPSASGASTTGTATGGLLPVTTEEVPVGTALVQLGAFESLEIASAEWTRLSGRFAEFVGGKQPLVQQAESGGRNFYRLRAMGFADLADARRFCAALVAENAGCIPVVVRAQ